MTTGRTSSIEVSTREIVDVALRSLRAHGASYAAARQAADLVEELQVVDGSGLPALSAALRRPVSTATVQGHTVDARGGSALLVATELGDLLSTSDDATLLNVGEPNAALGVLRRVADTCGGSWTAEWSSIDRGLRGGCHVDRAGHCCLWGDIGSRYPALPTVSLRVRRAGATLTSEARRAGRLPEVPAALARARQFGLTVQREQWTPLVRAAEKFLLGTTCS
ncbi:hypothetical protein [Amycolatopsis palatopharyngis]|uniref:hypothetical protein n=1 Tax=Amycolatopsis palatopharyngis TaxID=187982 RepID=UPI000E27BB0D|nr:hypothetical protein [Amycolatopsis palatopharyngis]